MNRTILLVAVILAGMVLGIGSSQAQTAATIPVTIDPFIRAETDTYFRKKVEDAGGIGKFNHIHTPVPIDNNKQSIIRMNRDTIYSTAVFDLTVPVTIVKPVCLE